MIITLAGTPGSGKSTAAKMVAKELEYKHYSVGDLMRSLSEKHGISLLELSKQAEKSDAIDQELDEMQISLAKKEDNFVIDSRLGWHFIPHSFKVFLTVSEEEAAQRIFNDRRHHEHENLTLEQTRENIRKRKTSEEERYAKYYSINPDDENHYDLVIDTTGKKPETTRDTILAAIR